MVARVCVVGSVNADLTFTVDALPRPGQTVLASSLSSSPGGKGGNQAVAAARAGASVRLVAALGTDTAAEQLRAHLRANEVGLDGVVSLPGPSGSAVLVVDSAAENTIVVAPGANAHLSVNSADIRAVIADSDVVLLQLEIPIATAVAAAGVARAAGAIVIINASPAGAEPHDLLALSELADVVVVNEAEARDGIRRYRIWSPPGARAALAISVRTSGSTCRRPRRGHRHHRSRRCVRQRVRRRMAGGSRGCAAPGVRGRRPVDPGAGGGSLRAVCGGDR